MWKYQFSTSLSLDSLLWLLLAASSLLLLAGLFVGNIDDYLDALEALKNRRATSGTSESGSSLSWQWKVLYLGQRFLHGSLLAKTMVTMYLTISVIGFFVSVQTPAVYEDRNVRVELVIDKFTWMVKSPERGLRRIDFCRDWGNKTVLSDVDGQAGYTMDFFRWEVTGHKCLNVANETRLTGPLGMWWKKDAAGWAIKTTGDDQ